MKLAIGILFVLAMLALPVEASAQCGRVAGVVVGVGSRLAKVVGVERRQARRAARQASGGWAILPRNR